MKIPRCGSWRHWSSCCRRAIGSQPATPPIGFLKIIQNIKMRLDRSCWKSWKNILLDQFHNAYCEWIISEVPCAAGVWRGLGWAYVPESRRKQEARKGPCKFIFWYCLLKIELQNIFRKFQFCNRLSPNFVSADFPLWAHRGGFGCGVDSANYFWRQEVPQEFQTEGRHQKLKYQIQIRDWFQNIFCKNVIWSFELLLVGDEGLADCEYDARGVQADVALMGLWIPRNVFFL